MIRVLMALALTVLAAPLARAQSADFAPVREADAFVSMIEGRTLRLPLYGLSLVVAPDGTISGSAMGWGVTGRWNWQDGYFCREMDWSGTKVPYDCQMVEAREDRLRFTSGRGTGDSAVFRLR